MNNGRTWCEIDMDALAFNYNSYRRHAGENVKIMAVIKTDAYGHGSVPCAKKFEGLGADYFAVAFADEAVTLRKAGIKTPILILGYSPVCDFEKIVRYDITATVFDYASAKAISDEAEKHGKIARVHIKIDTGMSRIGFLGDCSEEIAAISRLPHIETEGIFTHFACADEENSDFTIAQFEKFCGVVKKAEAAGASFKIRHCCNSAASIRFPQMHMDMIRIGISLYGCYPSKINYNFDLKPVMSFKTTVTNIKTLDAGDCVSYGATYTAVGKTIVATLAVGYGDGYLRLLSGRAYVLINGCRVKIIGRICMDQCMIDVTDVNNINVGDEVILFGTEGNNRILIDELAELAGTISYELLCNINRRVPRIYFESAPEIKKSL